jgi:hypothetical protein
MLFACVEALFGGLSGGSAAERQTEAAPRCEELLSTTQKTRRALRYGGLAITCSTSLPKGAMPVVGSTRPKSLVRCTSQAAR